MLGLPGQLNKIGWIHRHETSKIVKTVLILVSGLLLCAMASCRNSHHDIAGKWRTHGDANAMVWEFSKDGSVLMGGTRGRYSFGDRDRVKIQTPFGTSVYQMELSNDHMILKDPSGSRLEFTRSK
jgi:hypothetical protein